MPIRYECSDSYEDRAMKRLLLSLALSAIAAAAYAGSGKTTILHCGCAEEGGPLVYKEISVSKYSKGHRKHEVGSIDACLTGTGVSIDFTRSGDDCTLEGELYGLTACDAKASEPTEGDVCTAVVTRRFPFWPPR